VPGEPPTRRDLLRHTSGLRDYLRLPDVLAGAFEQPPRRLSAEELLALVGAAPRRAAGAWSYSSTNYLLLGRLVERLTGTQLRDVMAARVLGPLGLTRTELPAPEASATDVVPGHLPPDNPFRPSADGRLVATAAFDVPAHAADGLVSTAGDVARFLEALLDGELLPPPLVVELTSTVRADGVEADAYGLGIARASSLFGSAPSPCGPAWGHLGLMLGHTAVALSRRDGSRQVVVLANLGLLPPEAWRVLASVAWRGLCSGE
jgi:D-alanyl-D-alanine carboxypeptidase